jgi:aspartyl-tRNA(Asn)/glutamyl-tRNA(Gln) amidotransferase subunit C
MLAFAMPAGFTRSQVEAIAALAQLELAPEELDLFARQLGDILEYAKQVQQIDTAGVPPTATIVARDLAHSADRPDARRPSLERAEALANAPDAAIEAGLFKVPRVLG